MNRAALQRKAAARRARRGVSKGDDANTPPELVQLVRRVRRIVLDPCSNATSIVKADVELRLERGDDGLAVEWLLVVRGRGLTFVNCPYSGGQIARWSTKCRAEAARGVEIILLVNVDTSTEWYRQNSRSADARAFPPRISFFEDGKRRKGNQYSQVLFYWGPSPERFAASCRQLWKDDVEVDVLRGRARRAA